MTVLLVAMILVVFLVVDYLVQRSRLHRVVLQHQVRQLMLEIPRDVQLAVNHTWFYRSADGNYKLGVDEFLGRLLGTVRSIILPEPESAVDSDKSCVVFAHEGKVLRLASPLAGKVVEVNDAVVKDPSMMLADPYGKGWLIGIRPVGAMTIPHSFRVGDPKRWLALQEVKAKEFFARHYPAPIATMADGGVSVPGALQRFDTEVWIEFDKTFAVLHNQELRH
jgi:glycine cleavage system H protein